MLIECSSTQCFYEHFSEGIERKYGLFRIGLLTQWRVDVKFKVFLRFWRSGLRRIRHGSLGTAARINVADARHETVT